MGVAWVGREQGSNLEVLFGFALFLPRLFSRFDFVSIGHQADIVAHDRQRHNKFNTT